MIILPYTLTFLIGILALKALFQNSNVLSTPLFLCLACLAGIAESIFICFFSFIFFNQFHFTFIVTIHLIEIGILFFVAKKSLRFNGWSPLFSLQKLDFMILAVFCGIIALIFAKAYPFGGWDAWQVWNFKAKFLLLSGTRWKELFDPMLWRTSPHYPLALPLFNAWIWSFTKNTPEQIPLINTVIFNILVGTSMFAVLQQYTKNRLFFLPVVLLFLIPFYMVLATNQYCDILLGLFFLGSLITLYSFHESHQNEFLILTAVFLGLLSFTKPEGTVLSGIIFLGAHFYLLNSPGRRQTMPMFWMAMFIAAIPTMLFLGFLSPGNQTFINGLLSASQPSTLLRLKMIFAFLIVELFSMKWGLLWALILLAGVLNLNRLFKKDFFIFYFSISCYCAIIITYYFLNTYFKIDWWLTVSLSRILSSLLPSIIVWITLAICKKNDAASS